MNVLYSFPGRVGITGIGTTAWQQINALHQLGCKVTLVCGSCEKPLDGVNIIETMRLGPIPIPYRILGNDRAYRFHDHRAAEFLEKNRHFDAVHCWPLGSLATLSKCQNLGVPGFLERPNCHISFGFERVKAEYDMLGLKVPRNNTHRYRPKRVLREDAEYSRADGLLCPSEFVVKSFLDRGFTSDRLLRHHYGYDPQVFSENTNRIKEEKDVDLVFVGRCEPRKGLHYALDAWFDSGCSRTGRFLICGKFSDDYRNALSSQLNSPSIELVGFVNNVHDMMRRSKILILPAIEEGSALVTYEARAAGCVVLGSDASGAVGVDGEDILSHRVGNTAQLANQIQMLLENPSQLRDLQTASILNISKYTWRESGKSLLNCYQAGVSQPAATRGMK